MSAVTDFAAVLAAEPDESKRDAMHRRADLIAMNDLSTQQIDASRRLPVEDLNDYDDDALPTTLADVVVEGQVNWLTGHPGSGKTTLAMYVALQAAATGRDVLWLDWEGGRGPTKRRLRALGATAKHIAQLRYVYAPRLGADDESFERLQATLGSLMGPVVVFDSASKALATAGLSEDSNDDATKWTTSVVMPLRDDATVIVIDHVTKSASRTTPYARGAGAKLADTEVMWYVEAETSFSRTQQGVLRLTKHKDREGVLGESLRFSVGDGKGKLPIQPLTDASESVNAKLQVALLGLLRQHDGEALTTNQIVEARVMAARKAAVIDALAALADDPAQPVRRTQGPNRSWLYEHDASAVTALSP